MRMVPSDAVSLSPRARFGDYEIQSRIGAGGMGEVYRARDLRLGRDVALKVLPEAHAEDPERRERFLREARAAAGLSHPNIVTVYEVGAVDSATYIAMEILPGKTLREMTRSGPLPTRKILDYAAQIAQGLARAHEAGVVHRDLKPDNVIVTPDGVAKILDFGLAKLVRSPFDRSAGAEGPSETMTQPGELLGTYGYMSPEQANGDAVDFRSDQFSFGAVLYELAAGRPPFRRNRPVDTLSAILHEEPEPVGRINPAVPTPLRWIIERCLAKDPADRYASTQDLARELVTVREHLSEASFPAGAVVSPRTRWLRPLLASATALLVLAASGIVAQRLFRKPPPTPRFTQLTFRRGGIWSARFAPDGQTIVFGASWEGLPLELFETRIGSTESRSLGLPRADVLSISSDGEMAVLLGKSFGNLLRPPHVNITVRDPRLMYGTLAQVPLAGGAPRELVERALWADWGPPGRGLAVVHDAGVTQRLEYPIGTVLYENEPWINRPRVSPDGRTVAYQDGLDIGIVTPPEKPRSLGIAANEIAWSPSGREIWYSDFTGVVTELRAVTLSGKDRLITTLAGDFVLHDIARDGRVLVSRVVETSEIYALVQGQARPRNLSWLDRSNVVGLTADGSEVLFVEDDPKGGIYLRGTDGAPARRLGEGEALDISPDGKWVVVLLFDADDSKFPCVLIPTGAGERRRLPPTDPAACGSFFADGTRLAGMDAAKGQHRRLWVRDVEGKSVRAVTPEGTFRGRISPDGKFATALAGDGRYHVYATDGSASSEVRGLQPGEEPIHWAQDGRSIFVRGADDVVSADSPLARIYRLDPWSGRRDLFREIPALDPSAGGGIGTIRVSSDEKIVVYTHYRFPSELFLIEGLK